MQNSFPKLSETPGSIRSIAPQSVGADNAEIYGEMLGIDAAELGALAARSVI
jgi:formyl-CoA transferase